jgi:molybdopterin-guanine dinucleotide biosynthesis protein A
MDRPYAAIVLAGGGARRMGGRSKPALAVAGRPMLDRVLDAVAGAAQRVVVGPDDLVLPPGVRRTREHPAGGGPVAATAAGLAALRVPETFTGDVAVLAADLPLLDRTGVERLRSALAAGNADVALFVDAEGRWQSLCAVWRVASLRARCAALGTPLAGRAIRDLLAGADVVPVTSPAGPPPWFDCDTQDDLDQARSWLAAGGAGPAPAE